MMAVQGHFNHLDDPDENWDDEPLEIRRPRVAPAIPESRHAVPEPKLPVPRTQPPVPEPKQTVSGPAASLQSSNSTLIGAGLFEMTLGADRLPVRVEVNRHLHSRLDPKNFSTAAMSGYYLALWKLDAPIIAKGRFSALSVIPSRRAQIIALLGTRSRYQFEAIERVLRGRDEYSADGPWTDFGAYSVSIVANLSRISRICISPEWAATANPAYIAHDILDCANKIRESRPIFREEGIWSRRSDDELEYELSEYKNYLMRTS